MVAEQTQPRAAPPRGQQAVAQPAAGFGPPTAPFPATAPREPVGPDLRPVTPSRARGLGKAKRTTLRSPMALAVLVGSLLVTLLCGYVHAYARLTATSFETASLRRKIAKAKQEEESLRATIGRLSLPAQVERRARILGMVPASPQAAQVLPAAQNEPPEIVAQNR